MAWKEMERLEKEDGHETEELGFPTKCENSVGEGRKAEADDDDSGIDVLNIFHFPLQDSLQFPSSFSFSNWLLSTTNVRLNIHVSSMVNADSKDRYQVEVWGLDASSANPKRR